MKLPAKIGQIVDVAHLVFEDSDFRQIDVIAHAHDSQEPKGSEEPDQLVVRARRGYYTSKLE